MTEEIKLAFPNPTKFVAKANQSPKYPEIKAMQFNGEDMEAHGFKIEPCMVPDPDDETKEVLAHYKTTVRDEGQTSLDILQAGDLLCRAQGVQMFVMSPDHFKKLYKRKHS